MRPNHEVVDTILSAVGPRTSSVLLLGVTPELVDAFTELTAVDKSAEMIEALWQPSSATQIVREANWLEMEDSFGDHSAIVGDCSVNALQSAEEIEELMRVVRGRLLDNGVFACRVFERPDEPITEGALRRIIDSGTHGNFHAFKWQMAMSLAEQSGAAVRATDILARFNQLFPDRHDLAARTGWSLDVVNTIDVYEQSDMSLCFPNREEFEQHFSKGFGQIEWGTSGTYDLADRCPVVVATP